MTTPAHPSIEQSRAACFALAWACASGRSVEWPWERARELAVYLAENFRHGLDAAYEQFSPEELDILPDQRAAWAIVADARAVAAAREAGSDG